jgi:phenylalanyl-tRNA synthetase beta chain
MRISLNWLSEFVELPPDPGELSARLTLLGLPVASSLNLGDDQVLDLEVTTNRPDCLGHLGVAREVAAAYGKSLRPRPVAVPESKKRARQAISIEIADLDGCPRYCGRVLENVKVRPSPAWLTHRLESVGVRPINNVADVTNYVLMELGHPLHAFDLERLSGRKIIVRRARPREKLRTLDGADRTLSAEDLVIADAERPVALAGVMGGEDSEISLSTQAVMLESAWFEPVGIRRTSKRHGLHTEASHRFERGADIEMARQAIDRTAAMIAELAGGEIFEGVVDVYPEHRLRATLMLRSSEVRRILGAEVAGDEVVRILSALGFMVEDGGRGLWPVTPPSFRLDVEREVDLIEEIARLYGYERLPARLRPAPPPVERDLRREKETMISETLVGLGYRQIILPAMVDPGENARFTDEEPVRLANPLTEDASAMRSTSVPGMLRALRWNLDRSQDNVRFFEMGKIYSASAKTEEGLPAERRVLTLGISGARRRANVHDAAKTLDIFDLKGDLEGLLEGFDFPALSVVPSGCRYYEPGAAGRFTAAGHDLARFGQIAGETAREYKLRQPAFIAEIDLELLLGSPLRTRKFRPFSKFPAVERDLSLVLPVAVSYGQLEEALRGLKLEELQEFRAVDRFEGGAVPQGCYSLLLRAVFQSPSRTLTSEEVDRASGQILKALEPLGVRLRSA